MDVLLIIAAVMAAGIAVWLVARYNDRRRSQELARLALARGFLYQAQGQPFSPEERERIFSLIRLGGAGVRNILRGTAGGLECVVFDSFRRSGRGGHSETVAAFRLSLPDFELIAMRHGLNPALMAQVFSRLGFSVLTFDSHPEFSRCYLLLGRDETALRRLFTPGLLSYFEGLDRSKRWAVEGGGGWLLVHRGWQRIRPQQLPAFLDEAATVAAAIQRETAHTVTA